MNKEALLLILKTYDWLQCEKQHCTDAIMSNTLSHESLHEYIGRRKECLTILTQLDPLEEFVREALENMGE